MILKGNSFILLAFGEGMNLGQQIKYGFKV